MDCGCPQQGEPGTPGGVGVRGIVGIPVSLTSLLFILFPQQWSVTSPIQFRLLAVMISSSYLFTGKLVKDGRANGGRASL